MSDEFHPTWGSDLPLHPWNQTPPFSVLPSIRDPYRHEAPTIHLAILALLYFLPTIVTAHRGHGITVVLLLNLFFGWTIIVWFALLLWALLSEPGYRYVRVPSTQYPPDSWHR